MSKDKPSGKAIYIPGNQETIIKGTVIKPKPATPQDSIAPPPPATPSKGQNDGAKSSKGFDIR